MKNYKEVYEYYEQDNGIHTGIAEVEQAEQEAKITINSLTGNQQELKDTIDTLIGKIARAYETQGFCFGYDLAAKEARV